MIHNRSKLFILISFHLHFCVNYVDSFYTQRQRYASRMLKITPRECHSPEFPDLVGICMISLECQQRSGTVIGACRDGHLFGACCHDPQGPQGQPAPPSTTTTTTTTTTTSTTPSTTTTTTTTTTPPPTTTTTTTTKKPTTTTPTTTTTTSTEEPRILNNDISSDSSDASLEPDPTAIPSLIDTFSELSPTFLSELALDEHTTGIYSRGEVDLLPQINKNSENQVNHNNEAREGDSSSSALNLNSASVETAVTAGSSVQPVPSMSTFGSPEASSTSPASPSPSLSTIQNEIGGLAGFGSHYRDPDFKDNMIKYVDEIVTMRSNNEEHLPSQPPSPFRDDLASDNNDALNNVNSDVNEIPFSTFTIISSTKETERSPVAWSWTTSGLSDLSTSESSSLPVQTSEATEASTTTSTTKAPPPPSSYFPPSSTERSSPVPYFPSSSTEQSSPTSYFPSSSTERSSTHYYSPSEEILSVSVSQSTNDGYSTNDIFSTNDLSSTESSTTPFTDPTKFTFSKLKYSPRPYKPRSTTEKVVWTRPPVTTPEAFEDKPVADMDPEDDDDDDTSVEDEEPQVSSSSTAPSSTTTLGTTEDPNQTSPSTEIMMTTSTEGSPAPYSYMPYSTGYAPEDDKVHDDDNTEGYIQGHYFGDEVHQAENDVITSTTEEDPFYYSSSSPSTLSTGLADIDWTSPAILSYLKGASESFENSFYGNGSRSDLNGMPLPTAAANEITSPSGSSTEGSFSSTSGFDAAVTGGSSTWPSTTGYYGTGSSAPSGVMEESSSTMATSPSSISTTTGFSSTSSISLSAPSASPSAPSNSNMWDSSIDSFVDQGALRGGSLKRKSTTTGTTAAVTPTKPTKTKTKTKISSTTPAALKLTSIKNKLKSALEKAKFKTTSMRPPTKTPTGSGTTGKDKIKIKVKVPNSKTRTNKNKVKPVKKVTTANSPNSTRKRLNYKRDCGVRPLIKRGRIVGGTPSRFGSWPWHALVKETVWWGIFSKIKCGGVLIGPQHVLTAAHCQPQQTGTLSVVLGITDSDDSDSRAITKTVKRVIPHPQFNPRTYENDIAILELESPVDFQPHIVPICLPRDEDELEGKTAFVTGMGLLKHDGERPLVLQEVDLPILNNSECQKMFIRSGNRKPIIESFICAGYEQGRKDSCGGDSGGPLSVKRPNGQWVLAGTVSHGIKCALPDQPGVYMRTSYYKPWIDRVLNVARSRYRGIPKCNAPPLICARQRHHQQQWRKQQTSETGLVNTLFRIFRLARKMVEERRSSG